MHVVSVPAPATECHALRVRRTRAHSRPPVAGAMTPVGFCFALRERACADPQTSRSHVVRSGSQRRLGGDDSFHAMGEASATSPLVVIGGPGSYTEPSICCTVTQRRRHSRGWSHGWWDRPQGILSVTLQDVQRRRPDARPASNAGVRHGRPDARGPAQMQQCRPDSRSSIKAPLSYLDGGPFARSCATSRRAAWEA